MIRDEQQIKTKSDPRPTTDGKRETILDVAAQLFRDYGYDATSVRDIARAAGISQATLYYHIRSKADALIAIFEAAMAPKLEEMLAIAGSSASPLEKLRQFIHADLKSIDRDHIRWAIIQRERHSLPPEARARMQKQRHRVDEALTQILEEGMATGVFRPGPVKSHRMAILGITNRAGEWYRPGGETNAEQFAADFCDLILCGLFQDRSSCDH